VRVGLEATGHTRWFERLMAELGYELWIGDAAQITAMRVRKQKADRQDAQFLLKLLLEDRFPRVRMPSPENRDLRQLLWHRHRLVQMRTRVMNQLQSVAMTEGTRRRQDLFSLLERLNESVEELTAAVQQEAEKLPEARLLITHPGVGPVTALAFVLIIGYPERFQCGKQIGSYIGAIPEEASSAVHRRLEHISKQGSSLLGFLLVEVAQAAARFNPEWRRKFLHLAMRRERRIAEVAMARKLAVNLYWMWRKQQNFQPPVEVGSYAG
jgi:transposase